MTADKLNASSMQNLHVFKTALQNFPLKKYRSFHDEGLALKHAVLHKNLTKLWSKAAPTWYEM